MITILLFNDTDLKKDGTLKKKNNAKQLTDTQFKEYITKENLTLSKGYIDLIGFISNGLKFRAYYINMVIGVSNIIDEIEVLKLQSKHL